MEESKPDLLALFARLGELMHRYHHRGHRMHGPAGDPHRGQGRVMALLRMQPEISQKDLSFLLNIRPQSLGELLAKLERAGYIEREPSTSDRRVMDIRLTEKGREVAPESAPDDTSLFRDLDVEERERLGDYLSRIIARLEADLDDAAPDPEDDPMDEDGRPCRRHRHGPGGRHPGMDHMPPPPPHHHHGPFGPHDSRERHGPHAHHGAMGHGHGGDPRRGCCGRGRGRHDECGGESGEDGGEK